MAARSLTVLILSASVLCLAFQARSKVLRNDKDGNCNFSGEDYAVYSAVLAQRGTPEDPEESWKNTTQLIIEDHTTGRGGLFKRHKAPWNSGFRSHSTKKPASDTQKDFDLRLDSLCLLERQFDYDQGYTLISPKEVDDIFNKTSDGWGEFYNRYPGSSGMWAFSTVGYNAIRSQALVYVSHSCGLLCGTGHLYLLDKESGRWVVTTRLMLWIS